MNNTADNSPFTVKGAYLAIEDENGEPVLFPMRSELESDTAIFATEDCMPSDLDPDYFKCVNDHDGEFWHRDDMVYCVNGMLCEDCVPCNHRECHYDG